MIRSDLYPDPPRSAFGADPDLILRSAGRFYKSLIRPAQGGLIRRINK